MPTYHKPSLVNRIRYRNQDRNRSIDFMIIGVAKCGTSWLSRRLDELPSVQRSQPKETQFFKFNWGGHFEDWDVRKVRSIYLRRFWQHPRGNILFEASPGYLSNPIIANRIKKYFPSTKFVVLLRNPAERAYSAYNMWVRKSNFKETFDGAYRPLLDYAQECHASCSDDLAFYAKFGIRRPNSLISYGMYYYHFKGWLEAFPRNQFHLLTTNQLNDPARIEGLLDFIGVDHSEMDKMQLKGVRRGGHQGVSMKATDRNILEEFYAPYNKKLFDLLGIDSLDW